MVMDMEPCDNTEIGDRGGGTAIYIEENIQLDFESEVRDSDFDVTPLIQELMQHDGSSREYALLQVMSKIRVTFDSESKPDSNCDTKNVQTILKTEGCVAKFVELLDCNNHWLLQMDSVMILASIATEGVDESQAVLEAGALPSIISLLESTESGVRVSAAFALKTISSHPENGGARRTMLDLGVIHKLVPLLEGTQIHVETAVATLRHLCRVEFPPTPFEQLAPCLGPLALLTTSDDERVRSYASWALTDVALVHGASVFTVLTRTLVQDLEQMSDRDDPLTLQSPTLRLALILRSMMTASSPTSDQELASQGKQNGSIGRVTKGQHTRKRSSSPVIPGASTRSTSRMTRKVRRRLT